MKKRMSFLFTLMVILILIAGCQPAAGPVTPLSAALSELSGKVDSKQAADESFGPASADTVLDVNGQVQTGDDGRARLDLSTGTIIRVSPSSLFTLTSNDEVEGGLATKIKLDLGKIFIILSGGSAEVETPSGVATVRGSHMMVEVVEVDPGVWDIIITCLTGNCSATNPAGTANFSAGEKVVLLHRDPITGNWTAPNVEPMSPEDFQKWLDENPETKELFDQAMETMTALAATESPTEAPTEAPTAPPAIDSIVRPGGSSNACFDTLQPPAGASLPEQGQVTFAWESQAGAQNYIITFVDENGGKSIIETTQTSLTNYIEILPNGGEYSWYVTAYGASGDAICSTALVSFEKPQGDPPQEKEEKEEKEEKPESGPTEAPTEAPSCDPCDYQGGCYNPEDESCYQQ